MDKFNLKNLICMAVIIVLLAGGLVTQPARADVGIPPWAFPGSSLDPGEVSTQVQMVSEQVLLVVEAGQSGDIFPGYSEGLSAKEMVAHVEASFVMRNQGDTAEAFDVWFPIWLPEYPYYGDTAGVEKFAAWVDDAPIVVSYYDETVTEMEAPRPWATWPMNFPPGQDVHIHVTYDTYPSGNHPYGTFYYILETGADWWGPIGQGTVTIRLPFKVNEINTALNPDSRDIFSSDSPKPAGYTVSGNEVTWQFTDLEPTAEDNIHLTVMYPPVWEEIDAAQQSAAANPDAVSTQLRLANAYFNGLELFKSFYLNQGNSQALAANAIQAYQRAVELAPDSLSVADLVNLLKLLYWNEAYDIDTVPEYLLSLLDSALGSNPAEADKVVEYLSILYAKWDAQYYADLDIAPRPSASLLALLNKTNELSNGYLDWLDEEWSALGPQKTHTSTPIPKATSTPQPTEEPTATASPEPATSATPTQPTQTVAPLPSHTPAAQPAAPILIGPILVGVGIIVGALGAVVWLMRQKRA
jgi:hypothetical protein